jgi:hypothetical protein
MAKVEQVTLFQCEIPKMVGSLADALGKIAKAGLNGRILAAWEETTRGVLLIVVNNAEKAEQLLRDWTAVRRQPALAVTMKNGRGTGAKMAKALAGAGINITMMQATATGSGNYLTLLGTSDNAAAAAVLKKV